MLNRVNPFSGVSAGTTKATSGTVVFSNSNGVSFGLNGNTLTASVSGGNASVNFSAGTTSGNLGSVVFSNSNGLSFGLNGSTVTGSVATSLTNVNVSAGTTSNNLSAVAFSNSNGVSFGLNGSTVTASVATSLTNANVSAGTTSNNLSAVVFSNSNGVSFGLNGSTVTGSVGAQSNQTDGLYALGNTTQNSSTTLDARTLSFNALGGMTVGYSNGSIQLSAPQTVAQTNQTVGLYGLGNTTQNSSTTLDARSLSFNGLGELTVGYSNGSIQLSAPAQTVQTQNCVDVTLAGNTSGALALISSGTWTLAGGNNITVSQNGNAVTISGPNAGGAQTGISGISAGTTIATSGTVVFSNSNGVSFGVNGQTLTASIATSLTNVNVSAGTTSNNLSAVVFSNSNGVSFGLNGSTVTGSVATSLTNVNVSAGTTSNNLSAVVFSNSNGVSFGLNGSTVTGSIAAAVAQTNQTVGLYALGNTTQNSSTTLDARTISFNGLGAMTVGYSNGSVQLSVPVQTNQSIGLYAVGNTTQNSSTTLDARTVSYDALGAMSVGYSNGSVQLSVPATSSLSVFNGVTASSNGSTISISETPMSEFDPNPEGFSALVSNSTLGQNTIYFYPFDVPRALSAYRLNLFVSVATTVSAANSTGRGGYTLSAALYTRGTGGSTMSSFWSGSAAMSLTQNSNTQVVAGNLAGISNSTAVSTVATSISNANASTYPVNSMAGFRVIPFPVSSTLTPGRYWLALANSTSSSNAGVCLINCSVMQNTQSNRLAFQPFGTSSSASNASQYPLLPGLGVYSATSGAFPGSVGLTNADISGAVTATVPLFNISAYSTATHIL